MKFYNIYEFTNVTLYLHMIVNHKKTGEYPVSGKLSKI